MLSKTCRIFQDTDFLEIAKPIFTKQTKEQIDESIIRLKEYSEIQQTEQTVLGFDIYKYSTLSPEKQSQITMLFNIMYYALLHSLTKNHPLFKNCTYDQISESFISTGDGGYQVIHTPLHAIIILFNFHSLLSQYNSDTEISELKEILGEIEIRYVISIGDIYKIKHVSYVNHYGNGIIKNSRIMSKDRLNRFLIDKETFGWFSKNIHGIENLAKLKWKNLQTISDLSTYNLNEITKDILEYNIFSTKGDTVEKSDSILECIPMKLSDLKTKDSIYSVYNIFIKCKIFNAEKSDYNLSSLGNLNSNGLVD